MKLSNLNLITLKNKLWCRNCKSSINAKVWYDQKLASGLYTWMPLGYKVLKKLKL